MIYGKMLLNLAINHQHIRLNKIQLFWQHDHLSFLVANSIQKDAVSSFQDYIEELLISEPQEMYIHQVEKNVENDTESG
ncbi:hypothetical protein B9S53_06065 [Arthrospira sp. O9.13F]|nr:hypothetical protein B9S53_06065 [Arthrospira sp. O9.13F]